MGNCISGGKNPTHSSTGAPSDSTPNLAVRRPHNPNNLPPQSVDQVTFTQDPYAQYNRRRPPPPEPEQQPRVLTVEDPGFEMGTNSRNGWQVADVYQPQKDLGKGAFGSVYKATHKFAGNLRGPFHPWTEVAIKKTEPTILDKRAGSIRSHEEVERRCQEIKTLMKLRQASPSQSCVLHMFEYYWTLNKDVQKYELYLVTELLGEELDQWRLQQNVFLESTAKKICRVILDSLEFMHSRGVVHRDLKLQNILFRKKGDFKSLKVVDFGLAKSLGGTQTARDFCGSLGYIAPEIYRSEPYRFEVDMFAFGVILFRLLSGARPFPSTNREKLQSDTINLRYQVQGRAWEGVSQDALKLVRKLLIGPEERLDAVTARNHDWFHSQEESILQPDYTISHEHMAQDRESEAIAESHAPQLRGSSNRFWLDVAVEPAINVLLVNDLYTGRFMESSNPEEDSGLLGLQEYTPQGARLLPRYVSRLPGYTEKECRNIFRQIVEIVKISHVNGMAHRNIHINNFMAVKGKIMMRGLQYAQAVQDDQPLTGHFGYLYSWYAFKAPEIDSDFFHDKSVDIWSLGALLYMLLTALPPFRGDGSELIRNKHAGYVVFDMVVPSKAAQDLVIALLQVNAPDRLTIDEILNSEWMIEADDALANHDLTLGQAIMQDFEKRPTNSGG